MSFALIHEAWGTPPPPPQKKRKGLLGGDVVGITERFMPVNMGGKKTYDVSPDDLYDFQASRNGGRNASGLSFIDYDDFYRTDFHYSSKIDDDDDDSNNTVATVSQERQHPPPLSVQQEAASMEHFQQRQTEVVQNKDALEHKSKEQSYIEMVLYIVSGIFLILILEQFLQLGTKLA